MYNIRELFNIYLIVNNQTKAHYMHTKCLSNISKANRVYLYVIFIMVRKRKTFDYGSKEKQLNFSFLLKNADILLVQKHLDGSLFLSLNVLCKLNLMAFTSIVGGQDTFSNNPSLH